MLGVIFSIVLEFLGVELLFKNKSKDDDNEKQKRNKTILRILGIVYISIGLILFVFLLLH